MTKRAHLGLKSLFCSNSCALQKIAKIGAPSAKMTKRAALGLKTLIIFSPRAQNAVLHKLVHFGQCGNDITGCSRAEFTVLSKIVQFAKNG